MTAGILLKLLVFALRFRSKWCWLYTCMHIFCRERYRDLIEAADTITDMKMCAENVSNIVLVICQRQINVGTDSSDCLSCCTVKFCRLWRRLSMGLVHSSLWSGMSWLGHLVGKPKHMVHIGCAKCYLVFSCPAQLTFSRWIQRSRNSMLVWGRTCVWICMFYRTG